MSFYRQACPLIKEVKNAIDILIKNGTIKNNITVLQCNSSYPSPHKDANLKVMKEYEKILV